MVNEYHKEKDLKNTHLQVEKILENIYLQVDTNLEE